MSPLGRHLGGHLGGHVSALVDDQLPSRDAERLWQHVAGCASCRDAVQQELWVKDRLHAVPAPQPPRLPDPGLTAALAALQPDPVPSRGRRGGMRAGVGVAVVGTASAALTGVVLLAGGPAHAPAPSVDPQPPVLEPASFRQGPGASARLPLP